MFEVKEPIENVLNNEAGKAGKTDGVNHWNHVIAIAGRELRTLRVAATESGAVDLTKACGGVASAHTTAYAGARFIAETAELAPATLTAAGPVRWFFNAKLVGETKDKGIIKVSLPLKKGWNALLAKSWNPTNNTDWSVACTIASSTPLIWESQPEAPATSQVATDHRNVALWSEGSKVAMSSINWGVYPINNKGVNMLNDGLRPGSPNGSGPGWSSLPIDGLPQWAWVRFPGLRKIDSVVIYGGGKDHGLIHLVGEYSDDGGVSFKTLFEIKDSKSAKGPIKAEFQPTVTDNVRVRIMHAEIPATSAFETAQLSEIEVYGDNAPGNGSLSLVDATPAQMPDSKLAPDDAFKPAIKQSPTETEFSTPWYQVTLDRSRPRIAGMSLDSLGKGDFKIPLLRRGGAMALVSPMFDAVPFPVDGTVVIEGNVARYPAVTVAPGVKLSVALRFHEKDFELELATTTSRPVPLAGGLFRFDLDFGQTPTTFFGRSTDRAYFITLPCYMHAPDTGTLHITQSGDGTIFRQRPVADGSTLSVRQYMDITPLASGASESYGLIPAKPWRTTLRFAVESPEPFPDVVASEPRLQGMPRYALNIAQWLPGNKVMVNNVVSTNCPLSLQFYAEMAVYAPRLKGGIEIMDLVAASVDRYLDGMGGHLMWHGMKVEVQPPGKWYASLETGGFLLNSAWYAVHTVGGKPLLERWLPRLETLAGHLEAHDTDGDGIVDSGDRGHWFDNYKLPAGVKEAHSTAVNYEAFLHLAELEELAGRKEQSAHYKKRAQLIKDNYLTTFYNSENGVIGGWRDLKGKLHDPMLPWVNGYAICAGLVPDPLANQILDRLFMQMKKIGFTQYQYGLPTNLRPIEKDEWNYGPHGWEGYMNGSITPPYSNYVIMALYKLGRREQAEALLWPQIESFDKGTFNAGVGSGRRNPVGSAFYFWNGERANGVGYLPENWHAYAGIFAGHFGIRFDGNQYRLEPWSPLKGKTLPCNMPVMGKIQETLK